MQNHYLNQSLEIAEEVEKEFSTRANRKSRGVKQAPFYVISRTNMPSILIECGFLTNPKEEEFLHSKRGQDYIASAIFRAFKTYKENFEKDEPVRLVLKEEEKISSKKAVIDQVIFKVQIGTYLRSMLQAKLFKEIVAEENYLNGTFQYYVGNEIDKSKADLLKYNMLKIGFKGAFVVAFYKDKRISMKEALDLQTKIYNYE